MRLGPNSDSLRCFYGTLLVVSPPRLCCRADGAFVITVFSSSMVWWDAGSGTAEGKEDEWFYLELNMGEGSTNRGAQRTGQLACGW